MKFVVYLLFLYNFSFSQVLKVTVKDILSNPISANILIKNSANKELILEFFKTDDDGKFEGILSQNYSNVYFEITAMGYQKISDSITILQKNTIYNFDFVLIQNVTELQEIVVVQKKFAIDGDTVSFNPKSYKDGTERKVEDLIKNIPGMEVDANGAIKYRGKNVTSVQIEGDDLFGYNYVMGTRNISVDMIEQIQAINNYSANPLLRGIENTENVAINLKIKKGKLDISGNGNIGSGYNNINNSKYDVSLNLLGISRKSKSFGNISYNNIGLNNSSEDYFSTSANFEENSNQEFLAKKVIPEEISPLNFDPQRLTINKQFVVGYNTIYRFSNKLALKVNTAFTTDKLYFLEQNNTFFNSENIIFNDRSESIKNPNNKKLNLKLIYNINKFSLLEIESSLQDESIKSDNSIIQDQTVSFKTRLKSQSLFWKNALHYTYKIKSNTALQILSDFSVNAAPQFFSSNPSNFIFGGNQQTSEFKKRFISNKIVLLGRTNHNKYKFTLGSLAQSSPYTSNLFLGDHSINNFQNDFVYSKSSLYSEFETTYKFQKWQFQPTFRISYIDQKYDDLIETLYIDQKSLTYTPYVCITYEVNTNSSLILKGGYEEKTTSEEYFFTGLVAQNARTIKQNNLNLGLQHNQIYNVSYRYNNLFTSVATNLSLMYKNMKNSYISAVEIQDDFTIYNFFQTPRNIEDFSANFGMEKFSNFLNSTFKFNFSYSLNNYKNIINQSQIRNNQSRNYNAYFYTNTSFQLPINFRNKLLYNTTSFYAENQIINNNVSLNNNFKILIKPSKYWLLSITSDYYLPNIKNKSNYNFVDFELKYKPTKIKNIEIWLACKNLLNNKLYSQSENSDFQTSTFQRSLVPRYFLVTVDYKI